MANPLIATKATGVLTTQDRKDINKTVNQANTNKDGVAANVTAVGLNTAARLAHVASEEIRAIITIEADHIVGTAEGDIGHTDGAPLVAAPGAAYALQFVSAMIVYDYATGAYAGGNDDLVFRVGSVQVSDKLTDAALIDAVQDVVLDCKALGENKVVSQTDDGINLHSTEITAGTGAGEIRIHLIYNKITTGL